MKRRRELEVFSMSFLDAICCGFGSIILLFIISRNAEPIRLEQSQKDLSGVIAQYQEELNEILGETDIVRRNEATTDSDLRTDQRKVEDLKAQLDKIRTEVLSTTKDTTFSNEIEGKLASAKQSLSDEMKKLLADYKPPLDEYKVGGIPVDSEYIVFLVDTSGSMQQYAWEQMLEEVRQTLQVYPTVKGIQVMDDEGAYLFKSYRNEWIPDTPSRRQAILDAMKNWHSYSDSSPREGILAAIDVFADGQKKISLYVYSDDLAVGKVNSIVREVDRRNKPDANGKRLVRIHAVAFPTIYTATGGDMYTEADFAVLMRAICQRNGGTFVALPTWRQQRSDR
jgi:hypothetical protein